jgi:hypothetical protein
MLVHGLSPLGRRHPDIVRNARLLARRSQGLLAAAPDAALTTMR